MNASETFSASAQPVATSDLPDQRRILSAASEILRQGELLLSSISGASYGAKVSVAFNGSIGGHYRHCLDHFTSLLDGLDLSVVDYDHRKRDPRIEADPGFALTLTRRIRSGLECMEPELLLAPVAARCEVSYDNGHSPVTTSSLGRELVYIIAHAIHHYALISVMARLQQIDLPADFGIAPSTVAHSRSVASH